MKGINQVSYQLTLPPPLFDCGMHKLPDRRHTMRWRVWEIPKTMKSSSKNNPLHHTQKIKARMRQLIEHLREDVEKVTEPKVQALFETSAEVLTGLVKAFDYYEKKSEAAWRTEPKASRPKERTTYAARR